MAEEQVQEIPAGGDAGGGGGNPWIPVIAVIVLFPILSFVMTQFVLIPKIQAAVGAAGEDAHGGGDGHGDDAHGGGDGSGDDAHGGDADAPMIQYKFDDIVANLHGTMQSRYVKVSFTAEGSDPDFEALMETNKVKITDITIGVLNALSMKDLEQAGVKNIVRNDLLNAFHTALKGKVIHQIYFSNFLVQ